ncbi:MAG: hypothetical protein IJ666_04760 [Ruminococcus sp.]|nr:hypothetical protein [Ruminococcus sp.]
MKKRIFALILAVLSCFSMLALTGCGGGSSSTRDPEVEAYDREYIITHDMFGNPR